MFFSRLPIPKTIRRKLVPSVTTTPVSSIFSTNSKYIAPAAANRAFSSTITLPADSNQALGLGQYAIDFINGNYKDGVIGEHTYTRIEQFHTDSVMCGLSALALKTNAPNVLRDEAVEMYNVSNSNNNIPGAYVFGNSNLPKVSPEKAICANSSAVREWDSNGTVFGYNPNLGDKHKAGEFGHNDFYPVILAASEVRIDMGLPPLSGETALKAMICLDEIRGRLAEVFSLKSYKLDHVVHGAIGSAAVYGALLNASAEQIESAIGMCIAHYIPFRAIRAGKQLSDSKGASAAISTEAAVMSMRRAMRGFVGPKDIFRNPEAIFRFFEPTSGIGIDNNNSNHIPKKLIDIDLSNKTRWKSLSPSPFNLVLSTAGDDFAVNGMHFKLGLYEHQSAGALEGIINLIKDNKNGFLQKGIDGIKNINIVAYEPAYGIIGDPDKKKPETRQSADHSMAFIVSRMLQKGMMMESLESGNKNKLNRSTNDAIWMDLMLSPYDYGYDALHDGKTKALMEKITFSHGGEEYDSKYPDGIPTSLDITLHNQNSADNSDNHKLSSGFIMYPSGHARNTTADLKKILAYKSRVMLGELVFDEKGVGDKYIDKLESIRSMDDVSGLYRIEGDWKEHKCIDG